MVAAPAVAPTAGWRHFISTHLPACRAAHTAARRFMRRHVKEAPPSPAPAGHGLDMLPSTTRAAAGTQGRRRS